MTASDEVLGKTVLHRIENGICHITLNRPESGNAILPEQRGVIVQLLADADKNPDVRAIVLGATGRLFCAGADMRTLSRTTNASGEGTVQRPGERARFLMNGPEAAQTIIKSLLDCSKPIVAAVQGTAAGMGVQMALACDLIVMSETASFIESFILRGIMIDAGGAYLLPRRIGLAKAKEMVFFGDALPAREAERIGLVNKVVHPDEFAVAVADYATRLATAPTTAIGFAKRLLNRSLDVDRETAFQDEGLSAEANGGSQDIKEGIRAFMEKRPPTFQGF
jgi:2-(1,2-epoxy-1,2-dihydrophenyl)acetyl-CoA isomerase